SKPASRLSLRADGDLRSGRTAVGGEAGQRGLSGTGDAPVGTSGSTVASTGAHSRAMAGAGLSVTAVRRRYVISTDAVLPVVGCCHSVDYRSGQVSAVPVRGTHLWRSHPGGALLPGTITGIRSVRSRPRPRFPRSPSVIGRCVDRVQC